MRRALVGLLGACSFCAAGLGAGGCTVGPPDLMNPGDREPRTTSIYADVILSIGTKTDLTACSEGLPVCKPDEPIVQTGPCANIPVLGKNDMTRFTLGPIGRIELGFLCDAIVEVGTTTGPSNDFTVWAQVTPGAEPVVEVSLDGTQYVTLNPWRQSNGVYADNPGFQLEAEKLYAARFVRITNASTKGTIELDAVEALPQGPR